MPIAIENGVPNWLAAYPNEGALDYFGGRFYRQPHRAHLVRGAAANDFKNAKTLLFYSALCYAFRDAQNLNTEDALSEADSALWQRWFKNANFLYVVNYYAQHGEVPDRGFTGAIEAYHNFFEAFHTGNTDHFQFEDAYSAFYPDQRKWGYLAQFWRAPLNYFRTVLSTESCRVGEYGQDCFELFSTYNGWSSFIRIIQEGTISQTDLPKIQDVLDCEHPTKEEQTLARRIIFDQKRITGEENDFYKTSFNIVNELLLNGVEGKEIEQAKDLASVFTYKHLKNEMVNNPQEYWWRIVVSSLAFDCGIHRLYSLLGELADYDILVTTKVKALINEKVTQWLNLNDFQGKSLPAICDEWASKYLVNFEAFDALYTRLIDYKDFDTFIDGLLIGYLVSTNQLPDEVINTENYLALTDDYHHFIPRAFFRKTIERKIDFADFIENTIFRLIDEQYEFSIIRMGFGQKAKFILIKDEVTGNYIFQIDARTFYENQGIINMIEACLSLWGTAGLIEH
ncbi:hypothetical protein ACFL0N_01455 [Pseudomonadota bacterium]